MFLGLVISLLRSRRPSCPTRIVASMTVKTLTDPPGLSKYLGIERVLVSHHRNRC